MSKDMPHGPRAGERNALRSSRRRFFGLLATAPMAVTVKPAPVYATGGPVAAAQSFGIGERGAELFLPGSVVRTWSTDWLAVAFRDMPTNVLLDETEGTR